MTIKVLLADDDSTVLRQVTHFLKEFSDKELDVTNANSGIGAFEKFKKHNTYDIIVSDYQMPEKDGLELLEDIRRVDNDIPFIIFTGKGREEVAMEALNLGANRYIKKGEGVAQYKVLSEAITGEVNRSILSSREETHLEKQKFLLNTTLGFLKLGPDDNIYDYIAEKLEEIVSDSLFLVASYDEKTGKHTVRDVKGKDKIPDKVASVFSDQFEGQKFGMSDRLENDLLSLSLSSDNSEFSFKDDIVSFSDELSQVIETLTDLGSIKRMGISRHNSLFGSLFIFKPSGQELEHEDLIETLIRHASIALHQRKHYEKMRHLEEKYENLINSMDEAVLVTDTDEIIESVNPAALDLFGYSEEEMIGTPVKSIFGKKEKLGNEKGIFKFKSKNNDNILAKYNKTNVKYNGESAKLHVIIDVTERMKAEEKLKENEKLYRTITEYSRDFIVALDFDGNIVYSNQYVRDVTKYSQDELERMNIKNLIADKTKEKELEFLKHGKDDEVAISEKYKVFIEEKSGNTIPFEISPQLVSIGDRENSILLFGRNLTDREKIKKHYKERNRYNKMISQVSRKFIDVPFETDNKAETVRKIGQTSKVEFCGMFKKKGERYEIESFWRSDGEDRQYDIPDIVNPEEHVVVQKTIEEYENKLFNKKDDEAISIYEPIINKPQPKSELIIPLKSSDKTYGFILLAAFKDYLNLGFGGEHAYEIIGDIISHGLKKQEDYNELKKSERTYKNMYESALSINKETDPEKVLEKISEEVIELLEASGVIIYLADKEEEILEPVTIIDQRYDEEEFDFVLEFDEGLSGYVYRNDEGKYVNYDEEEETDIPFAHIDGTDTEEDRYSSILSVPYSAENVEGVITVDKYHDRFNEDDVETLDMFARFSELVFERAENLKQLKKSKEDMEENRNKIEELHEISNDFNDCSSVEEACDLTISAAESILDLDMCAISLKEDNRLVPVSSSKHITNEELETYSIHGDSLSAKSYRSDDEIIINDIEESELVDSGDKGYKSAISLSIGEYGNFQAVSNEKNNFSKNDVKLAGILLNHLENTIERIKSDERKEFLRTTLHHDLKNKTNIIASYLKTLDKSELSDRNKKIIDYSLESVKEELELIEKMNALFKLGKDELKVIDLKDVLEERISEIPLKGIKVKKDLGEFDHKIKAGQLIYQVITNVFDNIKAHSEASTMCVTTEKSGSSIIMTIEDDGKGVPEEIKDKVFNKGIKGKDSTGSGLGMYIIKEIANSYNADVSLEDSEMGGLKIRFKFKKAEES